MQYLLLALGIAMNVAANICAKTAMIKVVRDTGGSLAIGDLIPKLILSPFLYASIALFGGGFLVYIICIARMQVTLVYPILVSASIILVTIFATIFFGESVGPRGLSGITLMIVGIFLLMLR